MASYNGNIGPHFLVAEINFQIELPRVCRNQAFELYEIVQEEAHQIMDFSLILNNREAIVSTKDGLVYFSDEVDTNEIETNVISQVKIDKEKINSFSQRTFVLKVL